MTTQIAAGSKSDSLQSKSCLTQPAVSTVCEHLPLVAAQAERFAVVRAVHHDDPQHNNAGNATLTALGVDPETGVIDRFGRPVEVGSGGKPILPIFG